MATAFDYSPFFRSSIGFDRVFDLLENAGRLQSVKTWPPYDILRTGEDSYRIALAVPGYGEGDLSLTYQPNLLLVSGARPKTEEGAYLHRGIGDGDFEHRYELADYVRVNGARLENGLLVVDLVREVPEAMKPRRIAINGTEAIGADQPARLESMAAA